MSLERHLVRNRWLLGRFGVHSFTELQSGLESAPEGSRGDGHSHFLGHLDRAGLQVNWRRLEDYDRRVMERERELVRARGDFRAFKYFQYLARMALT